MRSCDLRMVVVNVTLRIILSKFCLEYSRANYLHTVTGFCVKESYFVFYSGKCLVDNY